MRGRPSVVLALRSVNGDGVVVTDYNRVIVALYAQSWQ